MPRPKVHPANRRRAAEACNFCRASKKRCSATVPCTACERRGIGASCFLTHKPRGHRGLSSRSSVTASQARSVATDDGAEQNAGRRPSEADASFLSDSGFLRQPPDPTDLNSADAFRLLSPTSSHNDASVVSAPSATHQQHRTASLSSSLPSVGELHSRMLLNRRGDRVFIGEAASLSFLSFLRDAVSAKIGPSQFSHNDKSESMLESQPLETETGSMDPAAMNISAEDRLSYVNTYFLATAGVIDIFSESETQELMNPSPESPSSTPCPLRDLVIAIGAQCKSIGCSRRIGQQFFRKAQVQAFSGMLEDHDMDTVRIFLLMHFYMLGHCRRNTASIYLGIAARTAIALGLHSDVCSSGVATPEHQVRRRVWMSLRICDIIVSSILGRPPATGSQASSMEEKRWLEEPGRRPSIGNSDSLTASLKILIIINQIIEEIYIKKDESKRRAEQLLDKVNKWSQSLPASLLKQNNSPSDALGQADSIARLHVSCLYYYAVTLVTRPILVSNLILQPGMDDPASSQLSSACIDAAVFLAQTCMDSHAERLMLGNMCYIKALIFAAGLILGFALFAEKNRDYEVEGAFDGAKDVLGFLSAQSPQAGHYLEILSLLSTAIDRQRQRQTTRGRNKYVGKILTMNNDAAPTSGSSSSPNESISVAPVPSLLSDQTDYTSAMPDVSVDFSVDWDALDLSQWDSFPFLDQRVLDLGISQVDG